MTAGKILNLIPVASERVASATYKFTGLIHAIRADAAGTCTARLRDDDHFVTYTLAAGDFAYGEFVEATLGTFSVGELVGVRFPLDES